MRNISSKNNSSNMSSISYAKNKTGKPAFSPSKSKKMPKKSKAEKIITGGIGLTGTAMLVSLFACFHPFSWEDIESFAQQVYTDISYRWTKEPDNSAVDEPDNSLTNENDVSYIDYTSDLGNISDFHGEPVFPDQEDAIFSCMLDTAIGPMLYYNQGDIRWKSYLYGGIDPISKYGCGPVCVAMLINSFGSAGVTPVEMADWAAANNFYAVHGGSYHSLIPESLSAYGLQVEGVKERTVEHAAELLSSGHVLVALMGKGSLTQNGHFIIIVQLSSDGSVYIADPANYENSTKKWSLQQLIDELKTSYDSGGPLWAVSLP